MHAYSRDPLRLAAYAAPPLGQEAELLAKPSFARRFAQRTSWSAAKAALLGTARRLRHSWPGKAVAALIAERQARLAIEELRTFDDRMLRDIGLQRMDIEGAVRGEFRPLPRDAEPTCNASTAPSRRAP